MNIKLPNTNHRLPRLIGAALLMLYGTVQAAQIPLPSPPPATVFKLLPGKNVVSRFDPLKILIGLNKADEAPLLPAVQRSLGKVKFVSKQDDPTAFVSLDLVRGNFAFSKSLKRFEGDYETKLPSLRPIDNSGKPEAQVVAEQYLTDNGLMPQQKNFDQMVFAAVETVSAARPFYAGSPINSDNQAVKFDKLRVVTFQRIINGLPVVGPGSKIVVTIGDKENAAGGTEYDVVSVIKRWSTFNEPSVRTMARAKAAAAQGAVIAPQAALENMQERIRKAFILQGLNPAITDVKTAYYDGNNNVIQPVYAFQIAVGRNPNALTNNLLSRPVFFPGEDTTDTFLGLIPALSKVPEPVYQLGDSPNSTIPLPKSGNDEAQ